MLCRLNKKAGAAAAAEGGATADEVGKDRENYKNFPDRVDIQTALNRRKENVGKFSFKDINAFLGHHEKVLDGEPELKAACHSFLYNRRSPTL